METSSSSKPVRFLQKMVRRVKQVLGGRDTQSLKYFLDDRNAGEVQTIPAADIPKMFENAECFPDMNDKIQSISVFRYVYHDSERTSRTYHAFVVFKTENMFYSIERDQICITLHRAKNYKYVACCPEEGVAGASYGVEETEWAEGCGTVGELIDLVKDKVLNDKYHMFLRNCQHFSAYVYRKFNSEGKRFRMYRKKQ